MEMGNILASETDKGIQKGRNFNISVPAAATTMNFTVGWPPALEDSTNVPRLAKKIHKKNKRTPSPISNAATVSDSHDSLSAYAYSDGYSSATSSSGRFSTFSIYSTPSYSSWNSQLHALLDSASTSLIWDVRCPLTTVSSSRSVSKIYGPNALSFPVTSSGAGHILLLSKHFPWSIEIGPKERAITASDVLHELYDHLHKDLDDAVWGMSDENTKAAIFRAKDTRDPIDVRLKNVDLLAKRVMFQGLYRDDKFIKQRIQPGCHQVVETWLVELGKPNKLP
ncbi:hypothetical protein SCHPADRAFT_991716 [Schizopora paradoxa]|uniref:DUF6699 domain-containing protein n=1 Tax=Schizopora paradoxa TaxID=27342 RepID=A0A0H2SF15_9AGAM|nr:hypothetical protein SCHPADRAFT_991716 [Schizopora paradoxa]